MEVEVGEWEVEVEVGVEGESGEVDLEVMGGEVGSGGRDEGRGERWR